MTTSQPRSNVRVFLADDCPVVRAGLARLIREVPGCTVCGQAQVTATVQEAVAKARPDLIILELPQDSDHRFELIRQLKAQDDRLRVLVFSVRVGVVTAELALQAGARGFVTKHESIPNITQAIRAVVDGRTVRSRPAVVATSDRLAGRSLSPRERQIYEMLGRGLTARQVAVRLRICRVTVETHLRRIKAKLAVRTSAEVYRHAIEHALLAAGA